MKFHLLVLDLNHNLRMLLANDKQEIFRQDFSARNLTFVGTSKNAGLGSGAVDFFIKNERYVDVQWYRFFLACFLVDETGTKAFYLHPRARFGLNVFDKRAL